MSNDLTIDEPSEMLEHGLWLIVGCLLASLVQSEETEVFRLPHLSGLLSFDEEGSVAALSQLWGGFVLQSQTESLASKPGTLENVRAASNLDGWVVM